MTAHRRMKVLGASATSSLVLSLCLALVGCAGQEGRPGGASSTPSAAPGAASTEPTTDADGQPVPLARNPWRRYYAGGGLPVEFFSDLPSMVTAANATVLGTVLSGEPGVRFVDRRGDEADVVQKVTLHVRVDELLRGELVGSGSEFQVEFGPFDGEVTPEDWSGLEGRQAVFVLRRQGFPVPGVDPRRPAELAREMYRLVNPDGLFDNNGGLVALPTCEGLGFVRELDGMPFDGLLADLRAIR